MFTMQFGTRNWEVRKGKIYSIDGLEIEISASVHTTEKETQNGVKKSGIDPISIAMEIYAVRALGTEPKEEMDALYALIGAHDKLYIGGKQMFTVDFTLTDVSVEDVDIGLGGEWEMAKFAVEFRSYDGTAQAKSTGGEGYASSGGGSSKAKKKSSGTGTSKKSTATIWGVGALVGAVAAKSAIEKAKESKPVSKISHSKK